VLALIRHGERVLAEAVFEDGRRQTIDQSKLEDWLTVAGVQAMNQSRGSPPALPAAHHRGRVWEPSQGSYVNCSPMSRSSTRRPSCASRSQLVDTPGVNDINEQRADITYGYVPRADAALFLLDATQILTASERRFIEERILRSCRDRLVFVVSKADLLNDAELEEATQFARQHLSGMVSAPAVFPISAKRALAGDVAGSRLQPLLAHLRLTLGAERVRLLLDHALEDAGRLATFVRDSLGMRRRSLELPPADLAARVAHAQERLKEGRRALDRAASGVLAEAAALKARVRQDLSDFAPRLRGRAAARDRQQRCGRCATLSGTVSTRHVESVAGNRGRAHGRRIGTGWPSKAIEVANQRVEGLTARDRQELSSPRRGCTSRWTPSSTTPRCSPLGALGTTVFLFVNNCRRADDTGRAGPGPDFSRQGGARSEGRGQAAAPEAVNKAAAALAPSWTTSSTNSCSDCRNSSPRLARPWRADRRGAGARAGRAPQSRRISGTQCRGHRPIAAPLRAIEERIAEIRQSVWDDG